MATRHATTPHRLADPQERWVTTVDSIAGVATSIGVVVAAVELGLARRNAKAQFEMTFATRYQAISDELGLDIVLNADDTVDLDDRRLEVFYRYFELCEEECYYRERGRITRATWCAWWEGMALHLVNPAFANALEILQRRAGSALAPNQRRRQRFAYSQRALERAGAGRSYDPRRRSDRALSGTRGAS